MNSHMKGMEPRFAHYTLGRAPAWALRSDQRFAYYAYVPPTLVEDTSIPVRLLVIVHGTERSAESYRDAFADFAEAHGCVVLAPLFPCGILEDNDMDNYKRLKFHNIRFDLILLDMVDEVSRRYCVERDRFDRFFLHGFSGGGQFAHRFFYLHPERLRAVSIGAPGAVTLLDETADWWVGTRNVQKEFGTSMDVRAMRDVRVQTVIGAEDFGSAEVLVPPSSRHWMKGANKAGADRQARLTAFQQELEQVGIDVERVTVPAVAHDGFAILPTVKDFFARVLSADRSAVTG